MDPSWGAEIMSLLVEVAIGTLDLVREVSAIAPAEAVFLAPSALSSQSSVDRVVLGMACAEICTILDRGERNLSTYPQEERQ